MAHDGSRGHAMFSMSHLALFYLLIENLLSHFEILKMTCNFNVLEIIFGTNCFLCVFFSTPQWLFYDFVIRQVHILSKCVSAIKAHSMQQNYFPTSLTPGSPTHA